LSSACGKLGLGNRKAPVSKCFPSTLKTKDDVSNSSGMKSFFEEIRFPEGLADELPNLRNKYGLLTKREVKMAGYWPSSSSRSINTQKKNEAYIQPSSPNKLGQ